MIQLLLKDVQFVIVNVVLDGLVSDGVLFVLEWLKIEFLKWEEFFCVNFGKGEFWEKVSE